MPSTALNRRTLMRLPVISAVLALIPLLEPYLGADSVPSPRPAGVHRKHHFSGLCAFLSYFFALHSSYCNLLVV